MESVESPSIPGYRMGTRLGRGATGSVYQALQVSTNREVALKVLRQDLPGDPAALARFRRETKLLATLRHPHLLRVYDVGQCDQGHWFSMELVKGRTLASFLAASGPISVARTRSLGQALGEALSYIHGHNILHRDIKPSNVLLGDEGEIRLADFGLARREAGTLLTRDAEVVGTLGYMAPEILDARPFTPAVDIYALGLVLVECLLGGPVMHGTEMPQLIRRVLEGVPEVTWTKLSEQTPAWLVSLLKDMTAMRPEARPAATEVHRLLRAGPEGSIEDRGGARSRVAPLPSAAGPLRGARRGIVALVAVSLMSLPILLVRVLTDEPASTVPTTVSPRPVATEASAPQQSSTVAWMRREIQESHDLVDRYDRTCPSLTPAPEEIDIRSGFFGDPFFRSELGELPLLFTALTRLERVIERGDEEGVEDPVWAYVDVLGYDIVEEAGRSNGFDTSSLLQKPLERLRGTIQGGGRGPWRRMLQLSMLSQFEYFRTLSRPEVMKHIEDQSAVRTSLRSQPRTWYESPEGRLVRWNLASRLVWTMEVSDRVLLRRQKHPLREAMETLIAGSIDELREAGDPLSGLTGGDLVRARLNILGLLFSGISFTADRNKKVSLLPLLNTCWNGLTMSSLAPRARAELEPQIVRTGRIVREQKIQGLPESFLEMAEQLRKFYPEK